MNPVISSGLTGFLDDISFDSSSLSFLI